MWISTGDEIENEIYDDREPREGHKPEDDEQINAIIFPSSNL
jgi:hypothetical protein